MVSIPSGRIGGRTLNALVKTAKSGAMSRVLALVFREQLGIEKLRTLQAESRGLLPQSYFPVAARPPRQPDDAQLGSPTRRGIPYAARAFTDRFADRSMTPSALTQRTIDRAHAVARTDHRSNPFCYINEKAALEDARASDARYASGKPLGALDGIVVPIKEEMHVRGLATRLGTRWMPNIPESTDSTAVGRLRGVGAIVTFQTSMTEYGLSPLGANAFRTMPRNPYDREYLAGGSSTGSAAAVALGFAPVALGCDGGGSVRTPSSMSGVFGLKPTYGRIPMSGHGLPWGNSMSHVGAMAAHTEDIAAFVEVAAGAEPLDPASQSGPALEAGELGRALGRGVRGLKIGIDEASWSRATPSQTRPCRAAVEALEREGAELVPIRLDLAPFAAAIGYVTIALEAVAGMVQERQHMEDLLADTQLLVSVVSAFKADDYVLAQRLRGALRRELAQAFREVDLIAHPTVGGPPPKVSDAEEVAGFVDPEALQQASAYCYLGNLSGSPAGTAPVGFDDKGLPVGLEILGDPWDEASVLAALAHLERTGIARVQAPPHHQDLMHESTHE